MDFSLSGYILLDKDFNVPSADFKVTLVIHKKIMAVLDFDRTRVVKFSGLMVPKENIPHFTIYLYIGNLFKLSPLDDQLLEIYKYTLTRKLCFSRICKC